jgi:hypothetical protein
LVYVSVRQVLQMLIQLACDDGAKDVELLVRRHGPELSVETEPVAGLAMGTFRRAVDSNADSNRRDRAPTIGRG